MSDIEPQNVGQDEPQNVGQNVGANVIAVLMAAGKGTRMKSRLPKTLHLLAGKPMVAYAVSAICRLAKVTGLITVVGAKAKKVEQAVRGAAEEIAGEIAGETVGGMNSHIKLGFVKQKRQLGTADAVKQALNYLKTSDLKADLNDIYIGEQYKGEKSSTGKNSKEGENENFDIYIGENGESGNSGNTNEKHLLVLPADTPNIKSETLSELIQIHLAGNSSATILTADLPDPTGYGRVVYSKNNTNPQNNTNKEIAKIVEQKDATAEELKIAEINTSIYCFNLADLTPAIEKVRAENASNEYYLPDVIQILLDMKSTILTHKISDPSEILGANTPEEFQELSKVMEK